MVNNKSIYFQFSIAILAGYLMVTNLSAHGQNKPVASGNVPIPSLPIVPMPKVYMEASPMNYIKTIEPLAPMSDSGVLVATENAPIRQSITYFDAWGRPAQTVAKRASAEGKDIVTTKLYDPYGREIYNYLPFTYLTNQNTVETKDGLFKTAPFQQDSIFNKASFPGEQVYYGQSIYENSPLSRVMETRAVGNSWAGSGRGTVIQQQPNGVSDSVRVWVIDSLIGAIPISPDRYAAAQLYKNVVIDEHGKMTIEYKDKEGQTVLKKVQLSDTPAGAHTGWLCTYYIYDHLNNLRFVVPPVAVEALLSNGWSLQNQAFREELCFSYEYDQRKRMIIKRIPGGGSFEQVYDGRDRLVFTRDANLKAQQKWLATIYDGLNRPTMTAFYNKDITRELLQNNLQTATGSNTQVAYAIPSPNDLYVDSHDGRAMYQARSSIVFQDGFESSVGDAFETNLSATAMQETINVTANNFLSTITSAELTPLTYTFYDNYNYGGAHAALTSDLSKPRAGSNQFSEPVTSYSNMTRGKVTGVKTRVLGTERWLTSTRYYDNKGRLIQTVVDNGTGGKDVITNLYDFNSKLLSTYLRHKNPRSTVTPETRMLTSIIYDNQGRIVNIVKRMNDDSTNLQRTIATNSYNHLGELKTKDIGGMETVEYDYNIRGWLKAINKKYIDGVNTNHYFGEELSYDYGFDSKFYNGNIGGIKWKGKNDTTSRAYGFAYDNAKRLKIADFTQRQTGGNWNRDQIDFSVSNLNYDANGNMLAMKQEGMKSGGKGTIDQLQYRYQDKSNRLLAVTDLANDPAGMLGDFKDGNTNGDDYSYDANGNLKKDLNKGIRAITYNHLNLPEIISITGKGSISFQYDATGNKLSKTITDSTVSPVKVTTTDYMSGLVYQKDTLKYIGHEEGRIRAVYKAGMPVTYAYDYFVKDHLGNIRTVLTDQSDLTMYVATMETALAAKENVLFSNVEVTRNAKPVGYPDDQSTVQNEFVARLSAKEGGKKIGPSLVLRVMTGDTIQIGAKAFYKSQGPKENKQPTPVEDMLASLVQAFNGSADGEQSHAVSSAEPTSPFANNFTSSDYQRLQQKDQDQFKQDKPKAYLNFVLFDEQFNLVEENSGVKQVQGEPDQLQTLAKDKMVIQQSGFLYVYTSNESPQDVFFDNVTVMQASGPVLEETHYYPFGLTMSGISSNALKGTNYPENNYKFNGKELNNKEFGDGTGLEWYDYGMREYDPQIGRFFRIDPLVHDYVYLTPYQYAGNEPIRNIDLDGLEPESAVESWDPKTLSSHTYSNGDKVFLIDNQWVSIKHGTYNSVYQYWKEGEWKEFPAKTQNDINKIRASGLIGVSNGLGAGFATILNVGVGGVSGGFSLQGLSVSGVGAALGDAGAQMLLSQQEGFVAKFQDINLASVWASLFLKNPFGGAPLASAFDFRIKVGFDKSLVWGDKTMGNFLTESAMFGIAGRYTGAGLGHLGLNSGIKGFIDEGLSRMGAVSLHLGGGGLTTAQLNLLAGMITESLNNANKKSSGK